MERISELSREKQDLLAAVCDSSMVKVTFSVSELIIIESGLMMYNAIMPEVMTREDLLHICGKFHDRIAEVMSVLNVESPSLDDMGIDADED